MSRGNESGLSPSGAGDFYGAMKVLRASELLSALFPLWPSQPQVPCCGPQTVAQFSPLWPNSHCPYSLHPLCPFSLSGAISPSSLPTLFLEVFSFPYLI